ncbi:MAG: biopolymer transporter ExbD [Chromatiales bacterium]|nr:biopolymer transporter ExbD [Chromatiales bacterium]
MGYERRQRSNVVLNLTPLIDIVFLLLVFFMLTAHFIEEQSIDITLPTATSADEQRDNPYVEITLTPRGEFRLNDTTVPDEELEQAIRTALNSPEKEFVRLRGDHQAQFGKAVKVIDAARNAGAASLDILTTQP